MKPNKYGLQPNRLAIHNAKSQTPELSRRIVFLRRETHKSIPGLKKPSKFLETAAVALIDRPPYPNDVFIGYFVV